MVKLASLTPAEDKLPISIGDVTLSEVVPEAITWVAPFKGQQDEVSKTLLSETGCGLPGPNGVTRSDTATVIWVAPGQALVLGAPVTPKGAAVTDQSDGWACLRLSGEPSREVLARLTPVDLRDTAFPVGATARTLLGHMTASITRLEHATWEIMVFRSMTRSAIHDLSRAMKGVAARASL